MPFTSDIGTQLGNEDKSKTKQRESIFSLTVNPNISTTPDTPEHKLIHDKLLNVAREMFGTEENFKQYIKFNIPGHTYDTHIIDVKENHVTIEYGKLKKWHIQASFDITHKSNIHLDRIKILKKVASNMNISESNIHIDITTPKKDDKTKMLEYPLKNRN